MGVNKLHNVEDLTLINVGNMVDIYLQKEVADLFNDEVDGIHCASVLMGYDIEFFLRKVRQNSKRYNYLIKKLRKGSENNLYNYSDTENF